MNNRKRVIKNHKKRGEWAELRFMARAAEHGFHVTKPWGDSARYDFAIDHRGRFLRVQVKSTIARFCDGYVWGLARPFGSKIILEGAPPFRAFCEGRGSSIFQPNSVHQESSSVTA